MANSETRRWLVSELRRTASILDMPLKTEHDWNMVYDEYMRSFAYAPFGADVESAN